MRPDDAGAAVIGDERDRTVVEWSGDGALMVRVGESGLDVQVQLEPQVMAWPAQVLADRLARLYRLALMRARAQTRLRIIESTGVALAATPGYPSPAEVDDYRRTIDF